MLWMCGPTDRQRDRQTEFTYFMYMWGLLRLTPIRAKLWKNNLFGWFCTIRRWDGARRLEFPVLKNWTFRYSHREMYAFYMFIYTKSAVTKPQKSTNLVLIISWITLLISGHKFGNRHGYRVTARISYNAIFLIQIHMA